MTWTTRALVLAKRVAYIDAELYVYRRQPRNFTPAAREAWSEAGVRPIPLPIPTRQKEGADGYVVGMVVRHASYGEGQVIEVSGYGALRKIKVRFARAGERTFLADKARLAIVRGS